MLTTLRDSPYNLEAQDSVIVQIKAHNLIGWSGLSGPSSGGDTVEHEPDPVTSISKNSLTSTVQIVVDWTLISTSPENGGSAVTSYNL